MFGWNTIKKQRLVFIGEFSVVFTCYYFCHFQVSRWPLRVPTILTMCVHTQLLYSGLLPMKDNCFLLVKTTQSVFIAGPINSKNLNKNNLKCFTFSGAGAIVSWAGRRYFFCCSVKTLWALSSLLSLLFCHGSNPASRAILFTLWENPASCSLSRSRMYL